VTKVLNGHHEAPALTKADFQSGEETRWCPGCGDYAVLAAVQGFLPDLGIPPERIVFITGIGCAGRFSYYMDTYGMHGIHGRAPALATGLAATRDDLSVWIVTGDGDALSIGANHLVHALRRNVPVKILLFNNRIYGLTKGQASPTSERGKVTKSTPSGSIEDPVDAVALALGAGATFVARTVDRDKQHLAATLRAAAGHPGAALVEVLQNCPVFNDGAFAHVTERDEAVEGRIPLEHGRPIRFGPGGARGVVRRDDGTLDVADVADVGEDALVVHDAHRADPSLAFALGQLGDLTEGPVPLGVFRAVSAPAWGEGLVAAARAAREHAGDEALDALLHAGDTWTVS
jgi:2-oxoglutarate/2-oxoacid ferredoxin oxidoreductase subunit beta